jgi:spermidine synthase
MQALFEELDFRKTPIGDLILRRRRMTMLDDLIVHEVLLGDAFLMSSLFHEVEEALADLGLAAVDGDHLDVVVGGLGLGYTAVAALTDPRVAELIVVDVMAPVIEWHEKGMVPLGDFLTGDPRCRLVEGDFFALAAAPQTGFDPKQQGRKFHAVLLDIDHSPRNLLDDRNSVFYGAEGLRSLAAQLFPGGVFALWSDDAPDEDFMTRLREVFETSQAHVVKFPNPLLGKDSESTVYVAVKAKGI